MSKVSFRARALDATKPMPVFRARELPDLPDFANINRSVPQMPTGMEKEEESEHHLQQALTAQVVYGSSERLVIPIPEVIEVEETYNRLYKPDHKPTKQYIHVQAYGMDQEIPDYDLDSDDENWLNEQSKKMELTPEKFEEMMDRLEKGSGQQVMKLQEAKSLLKEDDDLTMAVYDYWLNKRLRLQQPLIPQVKTEKRDGSTTNNPYVAFRRRTEKMQTRKNRKNDEASYEKMLKLRRDIAKAVTLLEMIKRREKSKKEILQLTIEILDKRYQLGDYSGQLVAEAEAERKKHPSFIPPFSFNRHGEAISGMNGEEVPQARKKRPYRRRNKQQQPQQLVIPQIPGPYSEVDVLHPDLDSSEEDGLSQGLSTSDHEDENDPDGPFAFRRKRHCSYHAPRFSRLGNWPWASPEEGGLGERRYRHSLMTLPQKPRCIGFARRRVGRGGRVIIDRAATPWDDMLTQLNLTNPSAAVDGGIMSEYKVYIRDRKIPHFQCHMPSVEEDMEVESRSCASTPLPELTMERFESHQKQLRQMQQEQEEKLRRQESRELEGLPGFSGMELPSTSAPSPQLLLDTAKAEFAASALMQTFLTMDSGAMEGNGLPHSGPSSTNCSQAPSSGPPTPLTPSTLATIPATLTNGPLATENKSSALSTSPAANVLQLNFPISSATSSFSSASTPSFTLLQTSSPVLSSQISLPHTSQIASLPSSMSSSVVNNRVLASNNSNIYKFSTAPNTLELLRQNHDDSTSVHSFNKTEKTVPMDVT